MNQLKPQDVAVKLQGLLGILHANHGLLHDEFLRSLGTRTRQKPGDVGLLDLLIFRGGHFDSVDGWTGGFEWDGMHHKGRGS